MATLICARNWWIRSTIGALLALAACTFPSRSERFACDTTADCNDGRSCNEYGYCVKAAVDGGTDTSSDGADASTDATVPADADVLATKCPAAGYTFAAGPGGYYRVVANGASWTSAQAACAADVPGSTHLIVLSTTAEVTY